MTPSGQPDPQHADSPAIRASDHDRDQVVQRLQVAFAENRLDDQEFDQRMRAALTARTSADLAVLTTDLPAEQRQAGAAAAPSFAPGKYAVAYKGSVRRAGRWLVPERFTSLVYKGSGWLDLRAAELTAPVTRVTAIAYKSRIDVLVPPGVRVEVDGIGISRSEPTSAELETPLPHDAQVVHIRGLGYKGSIEASTRPPEH
ncbi:MAG TPA: DUF1707 domain-containing protein [Streptosporangiaceae bacterium]|jgi:hypothetical protein